MDTLRCRAELVRLHRITGNEEAAWNMTSCRAGLINQEWSLLARRPGRNGSNTESLTHIEPEPPSAQRLSAQENTSVSVRVGNTKFPKVWTGHERRHLGRKSQHKAWRPQGFQTNKTKTRQHSQPMSEKMSAVGIDPHQKENTSEDVLLLISYCQHEELVQHGGASQCKLYLNSLDNEVLHVVTNT